MQSATCAASGLKGLVGVCQGQGIRDGATWALTACTSYFVTVRVEARFQPFGVLRTGRAERGSSSRRGGGVEVAGSLGGIGTLTGGSQGASRPSRPPDFFPKARNPHQAREMGRYASNAPRRLEPTSTAVGGVLANDRQEFSVEWRLCRVRQRCSEGCSRAPCRAFAMACGSRVAQKGRRMLGPARGRGVVDGGLRACPRAAFWCSSGMTGAREEWKGGEVASACVAAAAAASEPARKFSIGRETKVFEGNARGLGPGVVREANFAGTPQRSRMTIFTCEARAAPEVVASLSRPLSSATVAKVEGAFDSASRRGDLEPLAEQFDAGSMAGGVRRSSLRPWYVSVRSAWILESSSSMRVTAALRAPGTRAHFRPEPSSSTCGWPCRAFAGRGVGVVDEGAGCQSARRPGGG